MCSCVFEALAAETLEPLGDGLRRSVEASCGLGLGEPVIDDCADHILSTFGREAGILMDVHSVLLSDLKLRNLSLSSPDRMDNLLKVHN